MSFLELILIAVGLSMDAFAVSVCKGLAIKKIHVRHTLIVGLYFGFFQALMPFIGYYIGGTFAELIEAYDHWVVFTLLLFIGGKMVLEAKSKKNEDEDCAQSLGFYKMLPLALATSIDALAVGVSFAFLNVDILPCVTIIGLTAFLLSAIGIKTGSLFGSRFKSTAEIFGGVLLVAIGLKILLEHLSII